MLYMYEAIIITKLLSQIHQPKTDRNANSVMFFYFFLPPVWRHFMNYVNNNLYYVESNAEFIKASPSIHNYYPGTIGWRMTNFDEDSK